MTLKTDQQGSVLGPFLVTPVATSGWSHLDRPDEGNQNGPGRRFTKKPTWDISLLMEDTPEWQALEAEALKFENQARDQLGLDAVERPTCLRTKDGQDIFYAKSLSRDKFTVVDAGKQPYNGPLFAGGKAVAQVSLKFSTLSNTCVAYLAAVQVVERGGSGGGGRDPFEVLGKSFSDTPSPATPAAASSGPQEEPSSSDPFGKLT